ncbi:hypothetical protein KM043_014014 [Ampulex compressa]|nr:hypothetical protein KM043_014014 [Ampulex compressa]
MDFFDDWRYYRPTQLLLSLIGIWPYQDDRTTLLARGCVGVIWLTFTIAQVANIIVSKYDLDVIVEEIPLILTGILCCVKYITCWAKKNTIRGLFDSMKHDWNTLMVGDGERII